MHCAPLRTRSCHRCLPSTHGCALPVLHASEPALLRRLPTDGKAICLSSPCNTRLDESQKLIELDFTEEFAEKFKDKTKTLIQAEFDNVMRLLNFNQVGPDIVKNWYIDGRAAFHKIYDPAAPKNGLTELRQVDVAKLKRIIEIKKDTDPKTGVSLVTGKNEFYVYTEQKQTGQYADQKAGIKIAADTIAYVSSGLTDRNTNLSISYLHKAIRPLNQLRMMEDSDVIYRLTRAPSRRVFYIDTSGMARTKAEQYVKDVMARYKNKQVYDVTTGTVKDSNKHQSILEDFFLPRNSSGKGTEITTLEGAGGLGSLENTEYFQQKLWQALNIPLSRLQQGQGTFNIGRSNEITRDEIKFAKFIAKLRLRFNMLFVDLLKTQLLLKGITTPEDWDFIKDSLVFRYGKDNFFSELKESDMLRERLQNVQQADAYVGKYFSRRYIMRELLKMTDEECDRMDEQIEDEAPEDAGIAPEDASSSSSQDETFPQQ